MKALGTGTLLIGGLTKDDGFGKLPMSQRRFTDLAVIYAVFFGFPTKEIFQWFQFEGCLHDLFSEKDIKENEKT